MSKDFEVVYSIKAKIAGGGIGATSYNAVRGIWRQNKLKKLFCASVASNEIDEKLIQTIPVDLLDSLPRIRKIYPYWLQDALYDFLVSLILPKSTIFHVWNNHGLYSIQKAKKQGSVVVVERASSHILRQKELLEEEYKKFGIKSPPIHPVILNRSLKEYEEADFITVPSEFAYESFLKKGFKKEKLIRLNFGTDLEKYEPLKTKKDVFRVLFVGEIGLRKGVIYLLEAWEKLKLKEAELVLVGSIAKESENIFEKYRKIENIKFVGYTNPLPWYQQSSLFIFPSIEEGSALVVFEAISCGLPVITTFNSGTVVQDKKSGYIVSIRDPEAVAEKLEYLYNRPDVLSRMSSLAYKISREFSWDSYGENLLKAYEKIAS